MKPRDLAAAAIGALGLGVLMLYERRKPLRPRADPGPRRQAANAATAALGTAVKLGVERPAIDAVVRWAARWRFGLLNRLPIPRWLHLPITLAWMDWSLYVWHRLNHRVPWLWQWHRWHHADRDLDASTGVRFHPLELLASVGFRAAQVALIGARAEHLEIWQALTTASVLFHHSNVALPAGLDRALAAVAVTPRMHGIHHADLAELRETNYGSGLTSLWDRAHGTLELEVPQEAITIGVREEPKPLKPATGAAPLTPRR